MSLLSVADRQLIARTVARRVDEAGYINLDSYFRYYESTVYDTYSSGERTLKRAFRSHDDLVRCVEILYAGTSLTRKEFREKICEQLRRHTADRPLPTTLQEEAIVAIVRVGFMIDCGYNDPRRPALPLGGVLPSPWEENESFDSFVCQNLEYARPPWRPGDVSTAAWRLQKRNIKIEVTDNIMEHLAFDQKSRSLFVFRQVGFLRALSQAQVNTEIHSDIKRSLKIGGMLPPQLLLETLASIEHLLFSPVEDGGRNIKVLKNLIDDKERKFDGAAADPYFIRRLPNDFEYCFWAARLAKLTELMEQPVPASTRFMIWIENNTSERNALTVAIIALFLSVFFGLLSVLLGAAQLWVSILAWKYPQPSPSS